MRRKPGAVLPIEASILAALVELERASAAEAHGFELAKRIRDGEQGRQLTAHGTLYKALSRMETAGWLASRWEDPDAGVEQGRPRRRLYSITSEGRAALARAQADATALGGLDAGWSPS